MANATEDERKAKIESVLHELGLSECADTPVGSHDERGLSGGQRKRLSVAMELLDDPQVLVLDEPTSGLDSKAAEDLVNVLQALARGNGVHGSRLVICTIHQPSWPTLEHFDELLLISKGKVVYNQSVRSVPEYFTERSCGIPLNRNPADHVMRLVQEEPEVWANHWSKHAPTQVALVPTATSPWADKTFAVSCWGQFKILLRRNGMDYLKDKTQCVQQMTAKIFMGILIGLCWLNSSRPTECGADGDALFTVSAALFMLVNDTLMNDLLITVTSFPSQKAILMRDYKNGVYSLPPWLAAFWVIRLLSRLLGSFLLMTPSYLMMGLRLDNGGAHYFIAVGCLVLCSLTGTIIGLSIGAVSSTPDGAMGFVMPIMMPMMLFGGFMIPYSRIHVIFKWIYWISPFQYATNIFKINQFVDIHFTDDGCDNGVHVAGVVGPLYCNGNEYLDSLDLGTTPSEYMKQSFVILGILAVVVLVLAYHIVLAKINKKTG